MDQVTARGQNPKIFLLCVCVCVWWASFPLSFSLSPIDTLSFVHFCLRCFKLHLCDHILSLVKAAVEGEMATACASAVTMSLGSLAPVSGAKVASNNGLAMVAPVSNASTFVANKSRVTMRYDLRTRKERISEYVGLEAIPWLISPLCVVVLEGVYVWQSFLIISPWKVSQCFVKEEMNFKPLNDDFGHNLQWSSHWLLRNGKVSQALVK